MSGKVFRRIISTELAPKPVAPYNQAVVVDNTVYLSGVLGMDPKTNKLVEGGTVAEAKQAFINLKNILEASNSCYGNVVKSTVLLADMSDFGGINEIYKQYFKEPYPARTAYQVGKLPLDAKIEIEVIAKIGEMVDCSC
ncbi:2-iminobutanoate/2-iminopropanoate deaminase [Periplaneta americana]|uniref:2-iminobutanoate/2-iminopropanoate deaminase n=1 Tax=Periplaneta americana TaxID=6978 RepID=UPI0037E9A45A